MKTNLTLLALLVCTGCPDATPPSGDASESAGSSEATTEATTEPDLPAETSTDTETGTMTGDGDGDPGDGDGDGSTAQTASLVVESNGVRIGYLMGVYDYGFIVWDDEHEFMFRVNDQTGNVSSDVFQGGTRFWFYSEENCQGIRYLVSGYPDWGINGTCDLPPPSRRPITPEGVGVNGSVPAVNLWVTTGPPIEFVYASIQDMRTLTCSNQVLDACGMPMATTAAIPKTFELPITVDEMVMP
jgi:hypothetical protein